MQYLKSRSNRRPWWARKRWWLVLWMVFVFIAVVLAFVRSNRSTLVIYNDSGVAMPSMTLLLCGQTFDVAGQQPETSHRIRIQPRGSRGEIQLEIRTTEPIKWEGGLCQPTGGYRGEIHVLPDFSIDFSYQISFWQRWRS